MQQRDDRPEKRELGSKLSVIVCEAIIFLLFYVVMIPIPYPYTIYPLFAVITPLCLGIMFWYNRDIALGSIRSLGSKDMFVFFTILFAWIYIFAMKHLDVYSIFWEQAFIDEINFRMFLIPFIGKYVGMKKAILIQSVLFMAYYLSILVFYPHGFPGVYFYLFIIDMFSMGILYGAIFFIRKSVYIDLSIHLSLYAMSFVVVSLGWIPYLFLPS